ncbi:MAG: hypothetical protein M0Z33_10390 [Actinomycetota bacterium]|nr:hypothetical protein [Actinomycetota bacterium]
MTDGNARRGRRARGRVLRSGAAALGSAVVLAAAALYLVAPTRTALAVSIAPTLRSPAHVEVVYGRVAGPAGQPLRGARLRIVRGGRVVAVLATDARGTYRRRVRLARGIYELVLVARYDGRQYVHRMRASLVPGRSYRLSGRILPELVFTFLPVASY